MSEKKLRIGVAGLGRIGWRFHCQRLAQHADFALTAVADMDSDRRKEAEAELGCTAYEDYGRMLAEAGLDAVVIATPTHLHKDMTVAALESGLHVLLEKPMAPALADAEVIAAAAEREKRVLTVYQPHRLNAYFQHLKHIVESGRIGRITWVERASFSFSRRNDWQSLRKYGGGMLYNYGAHYLDQVLQLIGYDLARVFCDLQLVASVGDADDMVKLIVETNDGAIGEISISQASLLRPYQFLVWGTCGGIAMNKNELKLSWFDPAELPPKEVNPSLASENRQYPSDQLDVTEEVIPVDAAYQLDVFADLARAIRTGTPPIVKPRETLALMRVLQQAEQSSDGIEHMRR